MCKMWDFNSYYSLWKSTVSRDSWKCWVIDSDVWELFELTTCILGTKDQQIDELTYLHKTSAIYLLCMI